MRFRTFAALCLEHDHLGAEKDWPAGRWRWEQECTRDRAGNKSPPLNFISPIAASGPMTNPVV